MAVKELRAARIGFWLGWQVDTNWASPWLFVGFSILRPVAMSSILVVMYLVATAGQARGDVFAAIYLGNALWMYVAALGTGVSMTVMEEREWFQTLKYVFLGSPSFFLYVVGRAGARFVATTMAVVVVLAAGVLFLHVPIRLDAVAWPALGAVLVLGWIMALGTGLALSGVMLLAMRSSGAYAEALAGALFLFTGTLFPLDVLPRWAQAVGTALPFTYWLEALRRCVFGREFALRFSPSLGTIPDATVWLVLVVGAVGLAALGAAVFRLLERVARERGLLDQLTEN